MGLAISRRNFLAASSTALAATLLGPGGAQANSHDLPTGPVYGRVGKRGIRPGSVELPTNGQIRLVDGRTLKVRHETQYAIAPGASVLVAPSEDGVFSVLYAEI